MNCDDISSILNAHETDSLDAPRRDAVEAHLASCCGCSAEWRLAHMLQREQWPSAPAHLFPRIAAGLDAGQVAARDPVARRPLASQPTPRRTSFGPILHRPGALLAASIALGVGMTLWLAAVWLPSDADIGNLHVDAGADPRPTGREDAARRIAQLDTFEVGADYRLVANAASLTGASGATNAAGSSQRGFLGGATSVLVEVVQFFMYGCRPCYVFEPEIQGWETSAEHVRLVRVPVVFNTTAELHARAYYTAETLGRLDELHAAFFREIHERGNRLDSEARIAELFATFGIDAEAFSRAYRSPEVDEKVQAATQLARALGVDQTPSLVVDRRYLTSPGMTGSYKRTFEVVDALVRSTYDARRSDRCPPAARADGSRREEPLSMQELIDAIATGCSPTDRVF